MLHSSLWGYIFIDSTIFPKTKLQEIKNNQFLLIILLLRKLENFGHIQHLIPDMRTKTKNKVTNLILSICLVRLEDVAFLTTDAERYSKANYTFHCSIVSKFWINDLIRGWQEQSAEKGVTNLIVSAGKWVARRYPSLIRIIMYITPSQVNISEQEKGEIQNEIFKCWKILFRLTLQDLHIAAQQRHEQLKQTNVNRFVCFDSNFTTFDFLCCFVPLCIFQNSEKMWGTTVDGLNCWVFTMSLQDGIQEDESSPLLGRSDDNDFKRSRYIFIQRNKYNFRQVEVMHLLGHLLHRRRQPRQCNRPLLFPLLQDCSRWAE